MPNDRIDDGHEAAGNEHRLEVEGPCDLLKRPELDLTARFGARKGRLADSQLLAQLSLAQLPGFSRSTQSLADYSKVR